MSALTQYLSVNGDGTGSITAAVDASTVPVELSLIPIVHTEARIRVLTILVEDNGALLGDTFGSTALTNGLRLRVLDEDDVAIRELDGGQPIKRLADLLGLGARVEIDVGGTNKFGVYRIDLNAEVVLSGNAGHRLALSISDDLSNLVKVRILAEGILRGQTVA